VDPFHVACYSLGSGGAGWFPCQLLRNSADGSHCLNFFYLFKPFGLTCVYWLALLQCNLDTKPIPHK
jgi:hypothetical protein